MQLNRRYQDEDVRDNVELVRIAVNYVEQYQGDFKYLVDMKLRHELGMALTAPMIRGILNCMAGDPTVDLNSLVQDIPTPVQSAYGNVLAFPKPNPSKQGTRTHYDCPLFKNGIYHQHNRMTHQPDSTGAVMRMCHGLFRINRTYFKTKVKIKVPYIVARSGGVIHKTDPRGYCTWYPRPHELGYMMGPMLEARALCPSQWFREPRLLYTTENVPDWRPKHQGETLPLCKKCFPEAS